MLTPFITDIRKDRHVTLGAVKSSQRLDWLLVDCDCLSVGGVQYPATSEHRDGCSQQNSQDGGKITSAAFHFGSPYSSHDFPKRKEGAVVKPPPFFTWACPRHGRQDDSRGNWGICCAWHYRGAIHDRYCTQARPYAGPCGSKHTAGHHVFWRYWSNSD